MFKFAHLEFTRQLERAYRRLQPRVQRQCDKAVGHLFANPGHPGLNVKPILPAKVYWEARINVGDRLIFRPEGDTAYLMDIVTHDEISRYG